MIRRLLLVAAAAAAVVTATAAPVVAGGEEATLVDGTTKFVERTANQVLQNVPSPGGWQERHVCAWSDDVDKSVCVYFPWPI